MQIDFDDCIMVVEKKMKSQNFLPDFYNLCNFALRSK